MKKKSIFLINVVKQEDASELEGEIQSVGLYWYKLIIYCVKGEFVIKLPKLELWNFDRDVHNWYY